MSCQAIGMSCNIGHYRHKAEVLVTIQYAGPDKRAQLPMCWGTTEEILARAPHIIKRIDPLTEEVSHD